MSTGVIFYFGQRGYPDFGLWGQINLAAGVIRAWVFHKVVERVIAENNLNVHL